MGAWGYNSLENDTALDFMSVLINEDAVIKVLKRKNRDSCNYNEVRAAAEVLLHLSKLEPLWFRQKTINDMIEYLQDVTKDEDWFNSWIDGGKATKRSIKSLIRRLKKIDGY